jgi:hypothetical protein
MIVDAVNWYPGYTWEIGKQRILNVINSYGSKFSQPEGAGGFREDPVAWVTEGGWNCIQDYGLGIWWEKANDTLKNSIEAGDPRPVEAALRAYHDRVVDAGGVLYASPSPLPTIEKHRLSVAVITTIGDMLIAEGGARKVATDDEAIRWLLRTKRDHPALHQLSSRRLLPVAEPAKHYAFLKSSRDREQRIAVVMNFQPTPQTVTVDLAGVDCKKLTDLATKEPIPRATKIPVDLPPFGYRLFLVQ